MVNFDPSQVTTVVIPQGAEDQSSGKNYDPQYIRVIIGVNNTVRWINDGNTMNSIVADNSSDPDFYNITNQFSAVMENTKMPNFLKPGESFEYTFTKPGYFGYHGVPHPWQRGWVLVLTPDQSDKQIPEHVDLGASGLHDIYAVRQKIDFTIELSGYGITCPIPDIMIQRQDGNIIWHANHFPITSCDPERGGFKIQHKLSDGLGVPIINETGSYVMVISYDNQTMRLPFVVVSSTGNIRDLSESLPQYQSSIVPFGITALIIYHPPDVCLNLVPPSNNVTVHSCPPNKFYLKINSNSTTYLMGYNICDGNSCATNNALSLILPLNNGLNPDYQMIGLPVNLPWKYGDTVGIKLYVSPTDDNKTSSLVDLGNSAIVS